MQESLQTVKKQSLLHQVLFLLHTGRGNKYEDQLMTINGINITRKCYSIGQVKAKQNAQPTTNKHDTGLYNYSIHISLKLRAFEFINVVFVLDK